MYYKSDLKIEMFQDESRIKDMLGLLSLYFDKPLILINRQLDKQTKQMVCGYTLGHYLEYQLLMGLHTLNKFLTIKDKHIFLYEHNAFTSHLMPDSDEVYQMTLKPVMNGTLCLSITGFSCYFSFARISSALMPSASSFF